MNNENTKTIWLNLVKINNLFINNLPRYFIIYILGNIGNIGNILIVIEIYLRFKEN